MQTALKFAEAVQEVELLCRQRSRGGEGGEGGGGGGTRRRRRSLKTQVVGFADNLLALAIPIPFQLEVMQKHAEGDNAQLA